LFLAALAVGCLVPALGVWPLYLLIPIAGYLVLEACLQPLRRSFPGFPIGHVNRLTAIASFVIIGVSSAVLVGYHVVVAPDVRPLAERLPFAGWGSLILAGVCFSVANAVLEEIAFRGVLFDALSAEWGGPVAVAATSLIFGFGHQAGYPPGALGAVLAGLYGVALGFLRLWSGGLLASTFCHVFADATIFGILVYSEAIKS
jgi:uncharacterized protein